jgi:hypothetical protein
MSLNLQQFQPTSWAKPLFLATDGVSGELAPYLFFEAKLDFADVRSGLTQTCSISKAMELFPIEGDLLWTADMSLDVDPSQLTASPPPGAYLRDLPGYVNSEYLTRAESGFLEYVLRTFEVRAFRNFALKIYSLAGEALPAFEARCADLLQSDFRRDLDALYEVFTRRLEQVKQKFVGGRPGAEGDRSDAAVLLHSVAERLTTLFLRTGLSSEAQPLASSRGPGPDWAEKLFNLEREAAHELSVLQAVYKERIKGNDEYILHANMRNIHIVRTCFLWLPVGG